MRDGIIQKVIKRNLADMGLENSYPDCTCGYCKLGRTIEQELIEEIKKNPYPYWHKEQLIGDNE